MEAGDLRHQALRGPSEGGAGVRATRRGGGRLRSRHRVGRAAARGDHAAPEEPHRPLAPGPLKGARATGMSRARPSSRPNDRTRPMAPRHPGSNEVERVRRLGRRILDLTLDRTLGSGARKAWSGASRKAMARRFAGPPPRSGRSETSVLRRLRAILDDSMRMSHPRIFGLFTPAPLPLAALADMAAAFMNQSPDAWKAGPAATEVEAGIVRAFARQAR